MKDLQLKTKVKHLKMNFQFFTFVTKMRASPAVVLFCWLICFALGQKSCFGPGIFNSDGSGSDPVTNVPFSTSQNFGYNAAGLARWQTTHWSFPAVNGSYPTVRRDTYISLEQMQVFVVQGGSCTSHQIQNAQGLSLSCVPR